MRFLLCLLLAACGGEVIVAPTPAPVDTADTAMPPDDEPGPTPEPECRVDDDCQLDCCGVACACEAVPITVPVEDCEPMNCGIVLPPPVRAACVERSCATIEIE